MLFEVSDLDRRRKTHVSVLEFNGPEETCYMPMWIFELLCADVGDVVNLLFYIALVVICAFIYDGYSVGETVYEPTEKDLVSPNS